MNGRLREWQNRLSEGTLALDEMIPLNYVDTADLPLVSNGPFVWQAGTIGGHSVLIQQMSTGHMIAGCAPFYGWIKERRQYAG